MADGEISQSCCHLEAKSGNCLLNGKSCAFAADEHRQCESAGFVAHVTLAPDEFKVVVDRHDRPKIGPIAIKKCCEEVIFHAAGVYVNKILGSVGDEAKLEIDFHDDQRVELICRSAEVGLVWRKGRFSPM